MDNVTGFPPHGAVVSIMATKKPNGNLYLVILEINLN